jgi:hypothetical protein
VALKLVLVLCEDVQCEQRKALAACKSAAKMLLNRNKLLAMCITIVSACPRSPTLKLSTHKQPTTVVIITTLGPREIKGSRGATAGVTLCCCDGVIPHPDTLGIAV